MNGADPLLHTLDAWRTELSEIRRTVRHLDGRLARILERLEGGARGVRHGTPTPLTPAREMDELGED